MDETADCRRHDGGAQACRAGVEDILGEDVILPAVGDGRRVDNSDREAGSLSECYKSCLQVCIELSQVWKASVAPSCSGMGRERNRASHALLEQAETLFKRTAASQFCWRVY